MSKNKKPTVRAVVGSTSKKPSKKGSSISKRAVFYGLVGVIAFSVLGGFGWQKWDERKMDAKAAGWTYLVGDKAATYVCKTPILIKFYLVNKYSTTYTFTPTIRDTAGTVVRSYGPARVNGNSASVVWLARELGSTAFQGGTGINFASITSC